MIRHPAPFLFLVTIGGAVDKSVDDLRFGLPELFCPIRLEADGQKSPLRVVKSANYPVHNFALYRILQFGNSCRTFIKTSSVTLVSSNSTSTTRPKKSSPRRFRNHFVAGGCAFRT